MVSIRKPIRFIYHRVKNPFNKFKLYIRQKLGWLGRPRILPYIGFGNREIIYIRGRVVEDKELAKGADTSIWTNMIAMATRYLSDEIPFVRIQAEFNGEVLESFTNEFGEFEFVFNLKQPLSKSSIWHSVCFTLTDDAFPEDEQVCVEGEVMIALPESKFGVISDIDDTILISHSTSLVKKLRLMLLKNASTRLPFEGVAAFYRALQLGPEKLAVNPLFYVSSSEWNLYDLLIDFCDHQKIPKGTFMLHDLKVGLLKLFKSGRGKHNHKILKIRNILNVFKDLNFILIGDSGQKDPEIYSRIIEEFPGRILAVYIRDVSNSVRHLQVKRLAATIMKIHNVEMLLVKDTEASALHAIDKGFINKDTLIDIARERYKDQYAKGDLVHILTGQTEVD